MTDVIAEVDVRAPTKQACTLLAECVIEEGTRDDWKKLSHYHYRNTGTVAMITGIYRVMWRDEIVGVQIYARPPLQVAARNKVFGTRYRFVSKETRSLATARINNEIDRVSRTVIHPTFRGMGLAQKLFRTTMPLRRMRVIEASATMAAINPYHERCGMTAVQMRPTDMTERVLSAIRAIGASDQEILNPAALLRRVESQPPKGRAFVIKEMLYYLKRWTTSRTARAATNVTLEAACKRVAQNALIAPMYFYWIDPAWTSTST